MKGKKIMLSKEGNYGNWVPANMMKLMVAGDIVLAVLSIVFAAVLKVTVPAWITGVLLVILLVYTLYMWRCREAFDFNKGDVMGDVHQYLVIICPGMERENCWISDAEQEPLPCAAP